MRIEIARGTLCFSDAHPVHGPRMLSRSFTRTSHVSIRLSAAPFIQRRVKFVISRSTRELKENQLNRVEREMHTLDCRVENWRFEMKMTDMQTQVDQLKPRDFYFN